MPRSAGPRQYSWQRNTYTSERASDLECEVDERQIPRFFQLGLGRGSESRDWLWNARDWKLPLESGRTKLQMYRQAGQASEQTEIADGDMRRA